MNFLSMTSGTSLNLPGFCLRGFLLTRGPIPCPSFQPIFRNNSTPTVILRRKQKEKKNQLKPHF